MLPTAIRITVRYDDEAKIYWATSRDLRGLVTEAPTIQALMTRVLAVVPELVAERRSTARRATQSRHRSIPVRFSVEATARLAA
jgi:predicted RNase H-like HicB family nuclease